MSEPSKIVDEALGFLRGFPRPLRITALILLLIPFAIFLHGHYGWPQDGLVKDSVWINCIGSVFIVAVLFILAWYSPRPAMSVTELPESKPVFSESLKYFKEGPVLKGPRGELLKDVQNKFESSVLPNPFELPQEQMHACMVSAWELDRIVFYLFERYKAKPTLEERIKRVKHEIRLLETRAWQGSLSPLHYAVESVHPGLLEAGVTPRFSADQLEPFRQILKRLNSWTSRLRGLFTSPRGKGIAIGASAGAVFAQTSGKAEEALLAADAAWEKAYSAKDVEKSVAFFDEQGSMLPSNAPVLNGKDAITKSLASAFKAPDYTLTWHANKVGVASSGEGCWLIGTEFSVGTS